MLGLACGPTRRWLVVGGPQVENHWTRGNRKRR